jgi:hypothetical protein
MKYKKNQYGNNEDYDDEEYSDLRKGQKRRPIRNWKKAWVEHETEADVVDDFYTRR